MKMYSDEEDEERERLIKVVEYLQPLMSKELLCKFPDNSAFDFDYSQSSIWSPLAPRHHRPMDLDSDFALSLKLVTPLKLSHDYEMVDQKSSIKKVTSSMKKKIVNSGFFFNLNLLKTAKKKKKKITAPNFSPTPVKGTCYPTCRKGWSEVLKAATKHFKKKKKKKKKKRDSMAQMKISNYVTDGCI